MKKKEIAKKMKGAYYDKKSKEVKGLGAFHRKLNRDNGNTPDIFNDKFQESQAKTREKDKVVNAGSGRFLTDKEIKFKTRNWPK